MDLLETIISKAVAGDMSAVSEKEILMASLFELKSVKKELISLNEKIEKNAEETKSSIDSLKNAYEGRFSILESRVKINEEARVENGFWKKLFFSYIPLFISAIVGTIGIITFLYPLLLKFIK